MGKTLPKGGVRYAESKVAFLEDESEQWLQDHYEAEACHNWGIFIRDVNVLLQDILRLDRDIQASYSDGVPFDKDLDDRVKSLFQRWHKLASDVEKVAIKFEEKGHSVDGVKDLRQGIEEVGALLDPSEVVDGWIDQLRQQAVASNSKGETIEGLVD